MEDRDPKAWREEETTERLDKVHDGEEGGLDPVVARLQERSLERSREIGERVGTIPRRTGGRREEVPDVSEGTLRVPEEVVAALGDDPEREALEALLLHLIRNDRVSVAWAGERLGLDRQEAIRRYTSHGYPYPDITPEEFDEELRQAERFRG